MKHSITKSLIGLALASAASLATAGSLGFDVATIEEQENFGGWIFGIDFRVNSAVTIDGLGYFDAGQNGFDHDHLVNLFDSGGNLLASATVTSGSALQSLFRVASIAPITLGAGDYRVVGASFTDPYLYGADINNLIVDPRLTYLGDSRSAGDTAEFLTSPASSNDVPWGFFGPNVTLANAGGAVPEPTGLALVALGLAGLGTALRRSR